MFVFDLPLKCFQLIQNLCLIKYGHFYNLQLGGHFLIVGFLIRMRQTPIVTQKFVHLVKPPARLSRRNILVKPLAK